jgi:transcriptional regulator with XRE-family HTH domain
LKNNTPPRGGHGPLSSATATGIVAQLRARRLAQGLPLKVVAHRLGVSLAWLCRLEHERSRAAEQIERWAASLGADVAITTPSRSSSDEPLPLEPTAPMLLLVQRSPSRKRTAA